MAGNEDDIEAYLARIRRTIADSNALVSQAELRMAETDRLLDEQGLTREQVMGFRFSGEHKLVVNEELKRRGLPPIEDDEKDGIADGRRDEMSDGRPAMPNFQAGDAQGDLENRQRKFGMMMKPFQL
ncbi:MAG: hypothetical protein IJ658_05480 [Kiritimatiellae bacterium]|nr:hypothetical protein [Kiritimatiellia bacterium]